MKPKNDKISGQKIANAINKIKKTPITKQILLILLLFLENHMKNFRDELPFSVAVRNISLDNDIKVKNKYPIQKIAIPSMIPIKSISHGNHVGFINNFSGKKRSLSVT